MKFLGTIYSGEVKTENCLPNTINTILKGGYTSAAICTQLRTIKYFRQLIKSMFYLQFKQNKFISCKCYVYILCYWNAIIKHY